MLSSVGLHPTARMVVLCQSSPTAVIASYVQLAFVHLKMFNFVPDDIDYILEFMVFSKLAFSLSNVNDFESWRGRCTIHTMVQNKQ